MYRVNLTWINASCQPSCALILPWNSLYQINNTVQVVYLAGIQFRDLRKFSKKIIFLRKIGMSCKRHGIVGTCHNDYFISRNTMICQILKVHYLLKFPQVLFCLTTKSVKIFFASMNFG